MSAMFAVITTDDKKQAVTTYMSLTNGEALGPVELIKISPSGDEVEIKNSGTRMVLNLKKDGFEATASASPAPARGSTPAPAAVRPLIPGIVTPAVPAQSMAPAAQTGRGVMLGALGSSYSGGGGRGVIVGGNTGPAAATAVNSMVSAQPNASAPGVFPQTYLGANNFGGGVQSGGYEAPKNPAATFTSGGAVNYPMSAPSSAIPQPHNSTPTGPPPPPGVPMPPMP